MIPIHGDDLPTDFRGLALEFLEKIEDLDFVAAAIEDVADLDEGGGAADPAVGGVDEAGES